MLKRLFDLFFAFLGLSIVLIPGLIIALLIVFDSKGGVFFRQTRVGKDSKLFGIFKFRTMKPASDSKGLLTVGERDNRITKIGYFLRKYKIDELPQLINILKGDMSIVGPRPEVEKYVELYNAEQLKVLSVRPGLTDYASLEYMDESELLSKSDNPEKTYIEEIMPIKLDLALMYIQTKSISVDISIIIRTGLRIVKK